METFIWVLVFLVFVALVLSGKLRSIVQGFLSMFVEDVAKTPEGASAVFTKAIEEAERNYAEADDTYRKVSGQLYTAETNKKIALEQINEIETNIKALIKQGRDSDATLLAEKRESLMFDVTVLTKQISQLISVVEDAKDIHMNLQKTLEDLKKEKKNVVTQLKMNKQMEEVYDSMDSLKNKKHTDKLVSAIKDKVADGNESVAGAKVVHANRLSTKMEDIEKTSKKANAVNYIESLKAKK